MKYQNQKDIISPPNFIQIKKIENMLKNRKFVSIQICKYASMLALLVFVGYSCASEDSATSEDPTVEAPSSAKSITAFSFANPAITGTIDETAHTISLNFPGGINLTNLVATFTTTGASVTVGNVAQVSGTTPNDFSKTVIYTVTAKDGSKQNYTITPPNSADILGFTFEDSNYETYWELSGIKVGVNTYNNAPADLNFITGYPILPAGARITAFGNNEPSDYNSATGVTFTVTSANGQTTRTYTIKIPVYNKTTNPYGIYTPKQLAAVNNHLSDNFKLMNDITLPPVDGTQYPICDNYGGQGWEPIGYANSFFGTLDGDGHQVKNLTIKDRSGTETIGLIGSLGYTGVVKNLGLTSVNIVGKGITGALVALNGGGKVSYCYSTGKVSSVGVHNLTGHGVGGLVGYNTTYGSSYFGTVTNSYSTADVTGFNGNNVGGLVGFNDGGIVRNCYAKGSVLGTFTYGARGALIGKIASEVTNCYATGSTSGKGLIGLNYNSFGWANNSYWDKETTGKTTSDDGGTAVGKTTVAMKTSIPYDATWTSANWTFTAGQYPTLKGVGGQ